MQAWVNKLWYQGHPLRFLLWPLSLLFAVITGVRRQLFKFGLKQATKLPVPVIIVGNITVGGSGKTPMVIYLIELLRKQGFKPGVISRGYGVEIEGVRAVRPDDLAMNVGDEPAMIVARTQVPMVVGAKRVDAAQKLLSEFDVDIIISDDGLQHYQLGRNIELVILDGERGLGNGMLLPAGPLREGAWRLQSVDQVIVNGVTNSTTATFANEQSMQLQPTKWLPVSATSEACSPTANDELVAMAGIGNPQRFFNSLIEQGYQVSQTQAFDDHSRYSESVLDELASGRLLVMTEKDAVKCRDFAKDNWWYLAVDAKLSSSFDKQLLAKINKLVADK
ncbi:tetraacyldisaccharide 4'-kinase [Shewanella fidelis]|uniref:Tetraacyldisaccharide 4'-kinase n=1 Tax=Shewanella fidelis TaxID=173509 RepID=A0AAW8NMC5_9GAMM|nr:tetraacyldisaccharide 4'-kinase [Shewanella fidelis]MDR8523535.1 tetraacyldisaccharide 4'-kinase [Shewanella fidelis]MDW4810082.1 tetraacyldisaccharide 4'-kinase [Shewanella fidelis]MDW4814227.1 tetraacyldisaccharide 4'-kinase [Shewanella fidelis]MDW4822258.1 tetraacyldisaccharide 4'-kinase [Shewanella fidelis]MDW4826349.1 tetraacyldisaccharide 4'-kinase [Shewanella fidelis]